MTKKLEDLEEIKQLKARYFYCVDHKDWDGWRDTVFVPECEMRVPEVQAEPFRGVDNIVALASGVFKGAVSIHHGHMPIIEFTSADTATGIWAMEDIIYFSKENLFEGKYTHLHGFGHYHEEYVRTPAGWRIKGLQLNRLRIEHS